METPKVSTRGRRRKKATQEEKEVTELVTTPETTNGPPDPQRGIRDFRPVIEIVDAVIEEPEETIKVTAAEGVEISDRGKTYNEEYNPNFVRETYEAGSRFMITSRFYEANQWVMPGSVYEVTDTEQSGVEAILRIVRGAGPEKIKLGRDQSCVNKL